MASSTFARDDEDISAMTAANGRGDRRRRMMQESSSLGEPVESTEPTVARERASGASRYALADPSASFAIARRLPLQRRWLLAFTTLATAVGAAVIACDLYRSEIATQLQAVSLPLLDLTTPQSMAAWLINSLLLLVAGLSVMVYAMRRRRTDDLQGRYRWWLMASVGTLFASVCWATGIHATAASLLAAQIGWSPIEGFWWILPVTLFGGWAGFRLIMDAKESPLAATAMALVAIAITTAVLAQYEALPAEAMPHRASVFFGGVFAAVSLTVVTLLLYTRHMVMEADGVIAPPERSAGTASRRAEAREAKRLAAQQKADERAEKKALAAQQKEEQKTRKQAELKAERDQKQAEKEAAAAQAKFEKEEKLAAQKAARKAAAKPVIAVAETPDSDDEETASESRSSSRRATRSQPASARSASRTERSSQTVWTNGDDGADDNYDEEGGGRRKLTKAERKRLRKQKERQNRAA